MYRLYCNVAQQSATLWHMETKSRSIRVDDGVWEVFCARKGTQNEVMRDLLFGGRAVQPVQSEPSVTLQSAPSDMLQKIYERQLHMEIMLEELIETAQSIPDVVPGHLGFAGPGPSFNPAGVPGVQVGASAAISNTRNINGETVPTVTSDGRKISWQEQQEQARRQHFEKEKAKSSICDPSVLDVGYDFGA